MSKSNNANVAAALWTQFMASVRGGDTSESCIALSRLVSESRRGVTPHGVTSGQLETMLRRTSETLREGANER